MNFPKSTRWRSEKYLAWVRKQPCAICGREAEPHHIKGVGNFSGGGLKADDILVMPLCHRCHTEKMHADPSLWPLQYEYICRTVLAAVREGVLK